MRDQNSQYYSKEYVASALILLDENRGNISKTVRMLRDGGKKGPTPKTLRIWKEQNSEKLELAKKEGSADIGMSLALTDAVARNNVYTEDLLKKIWDTREEALDKVSELIKKEKYAKNALEIFLELNSILKGDNQEDTDTVGNKKNVYNTIINKIQNQQNIIGE